MRMWLCDPRILCQKHLCGEHLEMHMFLGHFKRKRNINGFLKNNLLELNKLFERHDELAKEMLNRGYKHESVMQINDAINGINMYEDKLKEIKVNKENALKELISRCPECKKRLENLK